MSHPIAFSMADAPRLEAHSISMDPAAARYLRPSSSDLSPAIVIVRRATILPDASIGILQASDVVFVSEGDYKNTILLVIPEHIIESTISISVIEDDKKQHTSDGDQNFLDEVENNTPILAVLARQTLMAIRSQGVDGQLVKTSGGRWKNNPLNTFTIKVQPRAENLQFTLYGNPETYDVGDFLLRDQNSYSRGWIKNTLDADRMAKLVRLSHARRKR